VENIGYTVILYGELLKCVDTSNGMTVGSMNIIGSLASGPIVTGDRCTVVINNYMGTQGRVFKLPSFDVVTTFSA
jgi:hypothetical protein